MHVDRLRVSGIDGITRHCHNHISTFAQTLFVWMKGIEKVVTITGAIPQAKAAELFPQLYPKRNDTEIF